MKKVSAVLVVVFALAAIYFALSQSAKNAKASDELLVWQKSASAFEFNGHSISYHDSGESSKDVILMLHGFPTSAWDWHLVSPSLSSGYRLVAADFLGFGLSDKPRDHGYSIFEQVDIQEALLAHLGVKRVHVLSHDYGDIVAQELLARYNAKQSTVQLSSVVLLNGGIFPEQHQARPIQTLLNSVIGGLVSSLSTQAIFNKSFTPVFGEATKPSNAQLDDLWFLMTRQNGHKLSHKLLHYIDDRFEYRERWVGALLATQVPLLLINGSSDPVAGENMVSRYVELVPDANVVELDNIGHYPHTEAPHKVVAHYKAFLNNL